MKHATSYWSLESCVILPVYFENSLLWYTAIAKCRSVRNSNCKTFISPASGWHYTQSAWQQVCTRQVLQLHLNRLQIITLQNSIQYRDISLHFIKNTPCWKCLQNKTCASQWRLYFMPGTTFFLYDKPLLSKLCTSVELDPEPVAISAILTIHLPINVTSKEAGFSPTRS
jgi:hypothetical protein